MSNSLFGVRNKHRIMDLVTYPINTNVLWITYKNYKKYFNTSDNISPNISKKKSYYEFNFHALTFWLFDKLNTINNSHLHLFPILLIL